MKIMKSGITPIKAGVIIIIILLLTLGFISSNVFRIIGVLLLIASIIYLFFERAGYNDDEIIAKFGNFIWGAFLFSIFYFIISSVWNGGFFCPKNQRPVLMCAGIFTEEITKENPFKHPVLLPTGDNTPDNAVEEWLGLDFDCVDKNGNLNSTEIIAAIILGPIFVLFGIFACMISLFVFLVALRMLLGAAIFGPFGGGSSGFGPPEI